AHDPPLGHITTFGGHPLSCAAALASLKLIQRERLWEGSASIGSDLLNRLKALFANTPAVIDTRGIGLLIGIEFDQASHARRFVAEALKRGVITNWPLNDDSVVCIAPHLLIAEQAN